VATRADTAHSSRSDSNNALNESLAAIVDRVEDLARRVEAQEQALAALRQSLGE
jgi:hypothetical protein